MAPVFSKPRNGRLELLLTAPHGLLTGQQLQFQVEAAGPDGQRLTAVFVGEVAESEPEPEARKTKQAAPEGGAERNPPYELRVVSKEAGWDTQCWSAETWTEDDAGCFQEPTESAPLILVLNKDAAMLIEAREKLLARQLDENTIKERLGRYEAHIYFHLFKMNEYFEAAQKAHEQDDTIRMPDDSALRGEINRVAATLTVLMDR